MKQLTHDMHIRITEDEYNELLKQRDFLGFTSYSTLIRSYIHTGICFRIDYDGLYEVATQISHIGNNINQIAAIANLDKEVTNEQVKQLKKYLQEIDKILSCNLDEKVKIAKRLSEDFFVGE